MEILHKPCLPQKPISDSQDRPCQGCWVFPGRAPPGFPGSGLLGGLPVLKVAVQGCAGHSMQRVPGVQSCRGRRGLLGLALSATTVSHQVSARQAKTAVLRPGQESTRPGRGPVLLVTHTDHEHLCHAGPVLPLLSAPDSKHRSGPGTLSALFPRGSNPADS